MSKKIINPDTQLNSDSHHNVPVALTLVTNRELISLSWQIGRNILTRQEQQDWRAKWLSDWHMIYAWYFLR